MKQKSLKFLLRKIRPYSYFVVLLIIAWRRWPVNPEEKALQIAPTTRIRAVCNDPENLSSCLNFTSNTLLNFMHFSKTGGTSVAHYLVNDLKNCMKKDGSLIRGFNTCYRRKHLPLSNGFSRVTIRNRRMAVFDTWRCDWDILRAMDPEELFSIDYIYGHQYYLDGAQNILKDRDVRTFAVIRHPLARKISFFYHFLVREQHRNEEDVSFEELRDFLIYDKLVDPQKAFTVRHDIGPNYMTGRLLSDGTEGFTGNGAFHKYFEVQPGSSEQAIRILKSFVFIGLQTENEATLCMFKKVLKIFKRAHDVIDIDPEQDMDGHANMRELNSGSYTFSEETVREKLSAEEMGIFERREHEDITIYEEGVALFWNQVQEFGCQKNHFE